MDRDPTSPQRYRILKMLGRGAMGSVYEATQVGLSRSVAIKFFDPCREYDEVALARFFREATMLAQLSHPGIVRIYDSGVSEDRPYLVMELVDGNILLSHTKAETPIPLVRALDLSIELLDVLQFLAEHDVVHRDIKPANLFETRRGELKLGDFGLARPMTPHFSLTGAETAKGSILGTPAYMAPEIFMGVLASKDTDLYAAGIVLYELIALRRPWGQLLSNTPGVPLRDLVPDAPQALEDLLRVWLDGNPEKRLMDRDEIRSRLVAIRETVAPASVVESPPSTPLRAPPPPMVRKSPEPGARPLQAVPIVGFLVGMLALAIATGLKSPAPPPRTSPPTPRASLQEAEMQNLIARFEGVAGIGTFEPGGVEQAGEALMRSELDQVREICKRRLPQIAEDQRALEELEAQCGEVARWDPPLHTRFHSLTSRMSAHRFVLWSLQCRLKQLAKLADKVPPSSTGNGIIDFAGNLSRHNSVRYEAEGVGLVAKALEKLLTVVPQLEAPAEGRAWRLRHAMGNFRRVGDYLVAVPWPDAAQAKLDKIVAKFEAGLSPSGSEDLQRVYRVAKFYWDLGSRGSSIPSFEEARWATHRDLSVIQSQSPVEERPVIEPMLATLQASLLGKEPPRVELPPRQHPTGKSP